MNSLCTTCGMYDTAQQTSDNQICTECGDTEGIKWKSDEQGRIYNRERMKNEWICRIEKTYSEDDYESMAEAEEQFINDIANNNFEFYTEEVEVDED